MDGHADRDAVFGTQVRFGRFGVWQYERTGKGNRIDFQAGIQVVLIDIDFHNAFCTT